MTNETNTARPVGDEALREALEDAFRAGFDISNDGWNGTVGCSPDSSDDFQMLREQAIVSLIAALASHPTTGQETVATPRGGLVREALKQVVMIQARELKRLDPHGSTPPDLDEAMDTLRAALSAPGSAGPGEALDEDRLARVICKAGGRGDPDRLTYWWNGECQEPYGPAWAHDLPAARAVIAYLNATPPPAQEPGTGDTGEKLTEDRLREIARDLHWYVRECTSVPKLDGGWHHPFTVTADSRDLCDLVNRLATPATTAETRGPAEGAR